MRMIARFSKRDGARHVSHLDLLRAMQRALRRAELPVKYSEGFNPHQVIAFGSAMSVGMESDGEWLDVALSKPMAEEDFFERAKAQMPPGIVLHEAHAVDDRYPALMSIIASADYQASLCVQGKWTFQEWESRLAQVAKKPLLAMKKGKKGLREVDLQELILGMTPNSEVHQVDEKSDQTHLGLSLSLVHASSGALNPQLLLPAVLGALEVEGIYRVLRTALWAENDGQRCPVWALPSRSANG